MNRPLKALNRFFENLPGRFSKVLSASNAVKQEYWENLIAHGSNPKMVFWWLQFQWWINPRFGSYGKKVILAKIRESDGSSFQGCHSRILTMISPKILYELMYFFLRNKLASPYISLWYRLNWKVPVWRFFENQLMRI